LTDLAIDLAYQVRKNLKSNETKVETRLDELAKIIQAQAFTAIQLG
jgi:uncharacterized protein YqgV (UPF0045/DUF77 family)